MVRGVSPRPVLCTVVGLISLATVAALGFPCDAQAASVAEDYAGPYPDDWGTRQGLSIRFTVSAWIEDARDNVGREPDGGVSDPDEPGDDDDGEDGSPGEGALRPQLLLGQEVSGWIVASRDNLYLRLSGNLDARLRADCVMGDGDTGGSGSPSGTLGGSGAVRARLTLPAVGKLAAQCSVSASEEYRGRYDPTARLVSTLTLDIDNGPVRSVRLRDERTWHPNDAARLNEAFEIGGELGRRFGHGPAEIDASADVLVGRKRYPVTGSWDADWWQVEVGSTVTRDRLELSGAYLVRSRTYLDEGKEGMSFATHAFGGKVRVGPFPVPGMDATACDARAEVTGYRKEESDGDRVLYRKAEVGLTLAPQARGRADDVAGSGGCASWGLLTGLTCDASVSVRESWDVSEAVLTRRDVFGLRASAAFKPIARPAGWTGKLGGGWTASRSGGGAADTAESVTWIEGDYEWHVSKEMDFQISLRAEWWGPGEARPVRPGSLKEARADFRLAYAVL